MHGAETRYAFLFRATSAGLVVSDLLCRTTHQWVSKDWQELQDDTFGLTLDSEAMDKSMRMITMYVEVACARRAPYP
ncbi:hypothetical protein BDZ89DRAFT_1076767 [Hymenopellis radicata]|nr:hypothetical protein BDZ89DRAFT_1076767 [Hymenopellis radicata]